MAVIGLWHAGTPNWLFWGMYHATGLAIFLTWARVRRRRDWRLERFFLYQFAARIATLMFVAASYTFVVTDKHGGLPAAFRLLAKLVGIDIENDLCLHL
jgi:alginate O-acetyltransferase complex protein AlgI